MNSNSYKASRGRPKTLNRDYVVDVAMEAYWKDGIGNVSINEICRKAKVSKPGLYREFGGEDGLMTAALIEYQHKVVTPMLQIAREGRPFQESLESLVSLVTTGSDDQEAPKGCLLVKMRESYMRVGEATRKQIDCTQEQVLTAYKEWVERLKLKGELSTDIPSQLVAMYIDVQLSNALSLIARGENRKNVRKILMMAFSVLE